MGICCNSGRSIAATRAFSAGRWSVWMSKSTTLGFWSEPTLVDVGQQVGLGQEEGADQEGPQPQAQHQQRRLIVGPVEVGQPLTPDIAPRGGQEPPSAVDDCAGREDQEREGRSNPADKAQGQRPVAGESVGKERGRQDDSQVQSPAQQAAVGRLSVFKGGAQGQKRRGLAKDQQRPSGKQQRKADAEAETLQNGEGIKARLHL